MPAVLGPNFDIFSQYRQVEIAQNLSFEEKNYLIDLLKIVYKDMTQDERKDIRLLIDLFEKKLAYEKSSTFATPVITKIFSPLKHKIQKNRYNYLDTLGELKRKERLNKTAKNYSKLVMQEAKESKVTHLGEAFLRLMNLLVLDIRAYNYEGSSFGAKNKNYINHKTIDIIRKAPFFEPLVHGAVFDLDIKTKSNLQEVKELSLIAKITLQESFYKLPTNEQKQLKPMLNAYGAVVNLTELASERHKKYNAYLETLYDYEKTSFEFAFESLRQDKQLPKIVKNYVKLIQAQYKHEDFEKKNFELMGKKLAKLLNNFVSFIKKPSSFNRK